MKKNKILLVCALALGLPSAVSSLMHNVEPIVARAEETICELTFPDDNSKNNSVGSYTDTWTAKKGNYEFEISNANNNNWNWKYIKFGSNKADSIGTIKSKTLFDGAIDKIKLTIDAITDKYINSIKLEISENLDFSTIKETVNIDKISKGEKTFQISNPSNLNYYKFTFDCKKSKSNGPITISNVTFFGVSTPSSTYTVAFDSN